MKIAILGGSFNPVHNGHLSLAENVYIELGFDVIVFFPAYISPFKQDAHIAPAHHRLAMLLEATKGNQHFLVDDFELNRQEVSYTIDTVRYCYSKYYWNKEYIIIFIDCPFIFFLQKIHNTIFVPNHLEFILK